jgi:hypothetical protein
VDTQKRRDGSRVSVICGGNLSVRDGKIYDRWRDHNNHFVTDDNLHELRSDLLWEYRVLTYGAERLERDLRTALAAKGYVVDDISVGRANAHSATIIVKPLAGPADNSIPFEKAALQELTAIQVSLRDIQHLLTTQSRRLTQSLQRLSTVCSDIRSKKPGTAPRRPAAGNQGSVV